MNTRQPKPAPIIVAVCVRCQNVICASEPIGHTRQGAVCGRHKERSEDEECGEGVHELACASANPGTPMAKGDPVQGPPPGAYTQRGRRGSGSGTKEV